MHHTISFNDSSCPPVYPLWCRKGKRRAENARKVEKGRPTAPQELQVLSLCPVAPHLGQSLPCMLTLVRFIWFGGFPFLCNCNVDLRGALDF
jgi:hypothetical protein